MPSTKSTKTTKSSKKTEQKNETTMQVETPNVKNTNEAKTKPPSSRRKKKTTKKTVKKEVTPTPMETETSTVVEPTPKTCNETENEIVNSNVTAAVVGNDVMQCSEGSDTLKAEVNMLFNIHKERIEAQAVLRKITKTYKEKLEAVKLLMKKENVMHFGNKKKEVFICKKKRNGMLTESLVKECVQTFCETKVDCDNPNAMAQEFCSHILDNRPTKIIEDITVRNRSSGKKRKSATKTATNMDTEKTAGVTANTVGTQQNQPVAQALASIGM